MAEWFFMYRGDPVGPVSSDDLRKLVASRRVTADTQIRRADSDAWVRADKVKGMTFPSEEYELDPPTTHASQQAEYFPDVPGKKSHVVAYCLFGALDILALIAFADAGIFLVGFFGMLISGVASLALAVLLKKRDLPVCVLIGFTFGFFALIAIPFMPADDGAR